MKSILKYILKNGLRDRLYLGLLISLIVSFSISIFLGSTMFVEQQQTTSAYIAGSSRAILAVGMILFVCLSVSRAFENKEVEFILSKSISREQFILGYLAGFFIAAFLIFLPLVATIALLTKVNWLGLSIWSATLLAELLIIICFSLLASMILKNSFSAIMASFAFYMISRLMGMFVMAIQLPEDLSAAKNNILALILKILSAIFPRLDLFSQSSWLSYGINNFDGIKIIAIQSLIYIPLMIFMSFHDFKRKQF
jgi:ABC-type transport system involved in multi-copper enzyme maturation permease subunit